MSEAFEYGSVYQKMRKDDKAKPERRRDGSYVWCVEYKDDVGKRVTKSTFRNKAEARDFLSSVQTELKKGTHKPDRDSGTVRDACDKWLDVCQNEENLRDSTLKAYREHVRLYILPILGDTKLSRLKATDVEEFVGTIKRGGVRLVQVETDLEVENPTFREHKFKGSAAMAKKALVSLKSALNVATRRGLATQNVAAGVRVTGLSDEREEVVIPTQDEMNKLLATAKAGGYRHTESGKESPIHGSWYPMLKVAAFTGLRISELRGLKWDQVDFDAKQIHVVQRAGMGKDVGDPKSKNSKRLVSLGRETTKVLKEWKLAQPAEEARKGFVFANGVGNVETLQNLYRRFLWPLQNHLGLMEKREDGKLEPRYGFHSFRHFYASVLISLGRSVIDVQKSLGHADPAFTLRVYGHLFEARDRNRQLGDDIEGAVLVNN